MRKIVFFDVHGDDKRYFKRTFKNVFEAEVACTEEPLTQVAAKRYADINIASVFITSDVNQRAIGYLPDLEMIATRSTGYDHIDIKTAKENHILTSTVPEYGEATVAEFTIMLLMSLARRLREGMEQVHDRLINHEEITGFDLEGKTIGLVGCGSIGEHVARIADGLGMHVIAYDPKPRESEYVEFVSLDELYERSHVVSLHAPSNKDNYHMIDSDAIAKMRKGVVLINTARGELVDAQALINGLYSGQVSAAGLDTLEGEQLLRFDEEIALLHPDASTRDLVMSAEHNVLLRMPNVIITPHNAFNSKEALQRIRHTTAENIKKYLMHEPQNVVRM